MKRNMFDFKNGLFVINIPHLQIHPYILFWAHFSLSGHSLPRPSLRRPRWLCQHDTCLCFVHPVPIYLPLAVNAFHHVYETGVWTVAGGTRRPGHPLTARARSFHDGAERVNHWSRQSWRRWQLHAAVWRHRTHTASAEGLLWGTWGNIWTSSQDKPRWSLTNLEIYPSSSPTLHSGSWKYPAWAPIEINQSQNYSEKQKKYIICQIRYITLKFSSVKPSSVLASLIIAAT